MPTSYVADRAGVNESNGRPIDTPRRFCYTGRPNDFPYFTPSMASDISGLSISIAYNGIEATGGR